MESARQADVKEKERLEYEDDFQKVPEEMMEEYRYLEGAPITCDFKENSAIGVLGNPEERDQLFKNMVLDIAARHYHTDLSLYFVVEEKNKDKLHWLRLLPHSTDQQSGQRNIVCDQDSKNIIFERLYKDLSFRSSRDNNKNAKRTVVFFYDDFGFKNHPISRFVDKAKELNYTFVFFASDKTEITMGCDQLIEIVSPGAAKLRVVVWPTNSETCRTCWAPSPTLTVRRLSGP